MVNSSLSRRWELFSSTPHRVYFFCGTLALLLATGFWLIDATLVFHGGISITAPAVNPIYAHGIIMGLGVFPFYICGFLLTTFPRWMDQPPTKRGLYCLAAGLQSLGFVLLLAGLVLGEAWIRSGLLSLELGWLLFLGSLVRVARKATQRPLHALIVLPAMVTGAMLVLVLALRTESLDGHWPLIVKGAIWWVLLPIFLAIGHRMIPFFSNNVISNYRMHRPASLLITMELLLIAHPLVAGHPWMSLVDDGALFLGGLALWILWQPWKATRNQLLLVLHIGFAWLWIGGLLFTIDNLGRMLGTSGMIWKAPLHTLTMGLFGSLLMAMTTRVSLGHSGRPLRMPRFIAGLFWLVQLATVLRLVGGLPQFPGAWSLLLVAVSGTLWLCAFLGWAWWFLPIYWQPRVEGPTE